MKHGEVVCLNYRHNGGWTLMADVRTVQQALLLAVRAYTDWGGQVRIHDKTVVVECPSMMGMRDVLVLHFNPRHYDFICYALSKMAKGWRDLYRERIGELPEMTPECKDRAVCLLLDLLEDPDATVEEVMCSTPQIQSKRLRALPSYLDNEFARPVIYGGQLSPAIKEAIR